MWVLAVLLRLGVQQQLTVIGHEKCQPHRLFGIVVGGDEFTHGLT